MWVGGYLAGCFSHSLPYHCQIALTYCYYRPCQVFFGPCDCQNVASRFPILLEAIEIANPYPTSPLAVLLPGYVAHKAFGFTLGIKWTYN